MSRVSGLSMAVCALALMMVVDARTPLLKRDASVEQHAQNASLAMEAKTPPLQSSTWFPESISKTLLIVEEFLHQDVFTSAAELLQKEPGVSEVVISSSFFAGHDSLDWTVFGILVASMLLCDAVIIRPRFQGGLRNATLLLGWWFLVAAGFNAYIFGRHGVQQGFLWCNGYLLEWLLSMDNLFVFHLIFQLFKTPEKQLHKALFWGFVGAIVFRMLCFVLLANLLHLVHWVRFVFGLFLIVSGIRACADEDDEEDDLENVCFVRFVRWALQGWLAPPPSYDESGALIVERMLPDEGNIRANGRNSRYYLTMLVPVIMCLEATDILFAVDSVSAKVAQIPDQYMAYTSSVLAMLGLRAMFFVVDDLVRKLHLLKYGLCFILVFIGAELIFADYVTLPASMVCGVLVTIFAVCVILSLMFPQQASKSSTTPTPSCVENTPSPQYA